MKVGVYFPGSSPQSGGGFTFGHEILQALLALCEGSHHEFTLYFHRLPTVTANPLPAAKNLQSRWVDSKEYPPAYKILVSRLARKLSYPQPVINHKGILQTALEADDIQMFWFVTPEYQTVDVPYIATMWDIQHRLQPWFPEVSRAGEWDHREKIFARFLRQATYIITPNQTGQDELSMFYQIPPARFRRLRHPVPYIEKRPTKEEVASILEKYHISNRYIFYPAQFWAHKNHINLLKAFSFLHENYNLDLDLVFTGSDKGNLEYIKNTVKNLQMNEKVHFLGFVPHDDLIALYAGAFALTYVTYFGPENLPPLEAFACGCPVIASAYAGAKEQLGDAALLVDGSKPEEIALAIKKIHESPHLREKLIRKGLVRAKEYSGLDYVRDVLTMFDEFEVIRSTWL
jgi:glycosyltransferase involved in cell wall biosynthesis